MLRATAVLGHRHREGGRAAQAHPFRPAGRRWGFIDSAPPVYWANAPRDSSAPDHGESGQQPVSGTPVLIVEDDPTLLAAVKDVLAWEGYPVVTATNGAEALEVVAQQAVSLVILDMRMPVMDGWAFAAALRQREIDLPLLVMTAAPNAQQWAEEIGASGHLAKPFDLDDLLDAVSRYRLPPEPR